MGEYDGAYTYTITKSHIVTSKESYKSCLNKIKKSNIEDLNIEIACRKLGIILISSS